MADRRVYIRRRLYIREAQPSLDVIDPPALVDQYARRRVSQIMEPHYRDPVSLQCPLESARDPVRLVRRSVRPFEDIVVPVSHLL